MRNIPDMRTGGGYGMYWNFPFGKHQVTVEIDGCGGSRLGNNHYGASSVSKKGHGYIGQSGHSMIIVFL
ncbi:hypothetical protein TNCT_227791 [Trichonephila clavata]|uniref:Uncharacterized protein n=1 Tax=Trichonephila clavata TaxID=2740835 RepID=A0A8X6LUG2_TRICU|nr:hypothetical protein TNCT_227791 [Trichonephila clavata]